MPIKYDKELLDKFCFENNITLLDTPEKIWCEAMLEGKCMTDNCTNHFKKMFKNLLKKDKGRCSQCVKSYRKGKKLTLYNWQLLKSFCDDRKIKQLKEDYSCKKLGAKSKIEGSCEILNCMGEFNITFDILITTEALCHECFMTKRDKTIKAVCNQKYGCDNVSQITDIKDKKKATCLKNYGYEYASQSPELQEKRQQTNLELYGYRHATMSDKVKEKTKKTCLVKYNVPYYLQSKDKQKKSIITCLKKYKFPHVSQVPEFRRKAEATSFKRFGTKYPMQSDIIKRKQIQNNKIKYGVDYISQVPEFRRKAEATHLSRYGVKSALQTAYARFRMKENYSKNYKSIRYKIEQTCLEKYGYKHATQNKQIMEKCSKNAYKRKDYAYPSGKIIQIQGYEGFALNELVNNDINEDDIITGPSNMPEIWYDVEGNKHRHYVDIFIPSQNMMIEVKSTWTAEKKKDLIFKKQDACKILGYNYEIWVYNSKGEKVECYK